MRAERHRHDQQQPRQLALERQREVHEAVGETADAAPDRADREQRAAESGVAGARRETGIAYLEHAEREGERRACRVDIEEPALGQRAEQIALGVGSVLPVAPRGREQEKRRRQRGKNPGRAEGCGGRSDQ